MARPGSREYVALLAMMMSLTALGIDMMLPAFDQMRASLDLPANSPRIGQTVTFYFLGLAVAQLLYGPLSDRFGRRRMAFTGIGIYVLGAIGAALAPSLGLLLLARFVWGIGAAGSRTLLIAMVRDSFEGDAMARMMSTMMAVFLIIPVVAPSLGALVIAVAPWRAVFWICGALAAAVGIWAMLRLPETLPPERRQVIGIATLRQSARRVLTRRETVLPLLATTMLSSVFTSYLASSELIIGDVFDRRDQFAVVFGVTAMAFGLASLLNRRLIGRYGLRALLLPTVAVYIGCALVLLTLALQANGRPEFWLYFPVLALLFGASMILNPNLNTLAMAPLGDIAGTASSIIGAVSTAGAALIGTMIDRRLVGSITPFSVAMVVSGFVTLGLIRAIGPRAIHQAPGPRR